MTARLIREVETKSLVGGWHLQHDHPGQRGDSHPGGVKCDDAKFHYSTQNSAQCKAYDLFISGIFHLIFLNRG